ncbi:MAG: AbrB/MazE/SpoVT family DNA-binding domain-containing protein [Sphingomonas sp.]
MNKPSDIKPAQELRIIKIGNSQGVILSRDVLAMLRVGVGDKLFLTEHPWGVGLRPNDPDFAEAMTAAEDIMREDRDILAVLAK